MVKIVGFTQFVFEFTCTQREEYNAIYRMKNGPVVLKKGMGQNKNKWFTLIN